MPMPATDALSTSNDRLALKGLMDQMAAGPGLPKTLLADAGYAGEAVFNSLQDLGIDPTIAMARRQILRSYDLKPPPDRARRPKAGTAPWRLDMIAKLKTNPAKTNYKKREQTIEPVFGILRTAIGFKAFSLRGIGKVKAERQRLTLACNCKRKAKLIA